MPTIMVSYACESQIPAAQPLSFIHTVPGYILISLHVMIRHSRSRLQEHRPICRYKPTVQMQCKSNLAKTYQATSAGLNENAVGLRAFFFHLCLFLRFWASTILVGLHRCIYSSVHVLDVLDVGVWIGPKSANEYPASNVNASFEKLRGSKRDLPKLIFHFMGSTGISCCLTLHDIFYEFTNFMQLIS